MAVTYTNNIDLTNNQILNAGAQQLASAPSGKPLGHIYYNTVSNDLLANINGAYATLLTNAAAIDHDALLNFAADEHVAHSGVSLSISGTTNQISVSGAGGDITANRSWTLSTPQDISTTSTVQFGSATLVRAGVALTVQNNSDAAAAQVAILRGGDRATAADGDLAFVTLQLENDLGTQVEFARVSWRADDVTDTTRDGSLLFGVHVNDVLTTRLTLSSTGVAVTGALTLDGTGVVLTSRTVSAGLGLTGGGDLSANRSFAIDIPGLTADASPVGSTDYVMTYDASANTLKKVLLENLPGGSGGHTQNTDTGTTGSTFEIDSDATNSATLRANTVALTADRTFDFPDESGTLLTTASSVTALSDVSDAGSGAIITTGERAALHTQNTDTGTTGSTFDIDSDGGSSGVRLKAVGGEFQLRNIADNAYADIRIKDLFVEGTTTTVNSETVTIDDNIIVLNDNVTGSPTEDAGIEVERGTSTNSQLLWDESNDWWAANNGTSTLKIARTFASNVGNGSSTSIAVTHNLNTKDVIVGCYRVSDDKGVIVDVTHTSTTQVTLDFATAPTSNQYRVVITG